MDVFLDDGDEFEDTSPDTSVPLELWQNPPRNTIASTEDPEEDDEEDYEQDPAGSLDVITASQKLRDSLKDVKLRMSSREEDEWETSSNIEAETWNCQVMSEADMMHPLPAWTILELEPLGKMNSNGGKEASAATSMMTNTGSVSWGNVEYHTNDGIFKPSMSSDSGESQVLMHFETYDGIVQAPKANGSTDNDGFAINLSGRSSITSSGGASVSSMGEEVVHRQKSFNREQLTWVRMIGRTMTEDRYHDGSSLTSEFHCDEETFQRSVQHMSSGPSNRQLEATLQFEVASEEVLRATMAYTPLHRFGRLIRRHKQGFARSKDDEEEEEDTEPPPDDLPDMSVPAMQNGTRSLKSEVSDAPTGGSHASRRDNESARSLSARSQSARSASMLSTESKHSLRSMYSSSRSEPSYLVSAVQSLVFWTVTQQYDAFAKSFQTKTIDDFWSHSWRAPGIPKVLTLMLYYNSLPGAVIGSIFAAVMCVFIYSDRLAGSPEFDPIWTLDCASVAFVFTLFFWQARSRVFLDKVCINQTDLNLKKKGVESIGGFLKHSKAVLMLWDPSYGKRLWCVFELASFTKIHSPDGTQAAPIIVRPVSQGPLIFMLMAVLIVCLNTYHALAKFVDDGDGFDSEWFTAAVAISLLLLLVSILVHTFDAYNRNMRTFFKQLRHFQVRKSECFCCQANHIDPLTGKELLCDRAIVYTCIQRWFASHEGFEAFVKLQLFERFQNQLGRMYLPYRATIVGSLPLLWSLAGSAASDLREQWRALRVVTWSVRALTCWLAMAPLVVAIWLLTLRQAQWLKAIFPYKSRPKTRAVVFSIQVGFLACIPPVLFYASVLAVEEFASDWGDFVLAVIYGIPTAIVYRRHGSIC